MNYSLKFAIFFLFIIVIITIILLWEFINLRVIEPCNIINEKRAGNAVSDSTGSLYLGIKVRHLPKGEIRVIDNLKNKKNQHRNIFNTSALKGLSCAQWSATTTIFKRNEALFNQAKLPDWCMVIALDKDVFIDPNSYHDGLSKEEIKRLVILTDDIQREIAKNEPLISQLPWHSFGRKNVAFLWAIANGAERIWDFDDDNALKPGISPILEYPSQERPFYKPTVSHGPYNPYPAMGCSTMKTQKAINLNIDFLNICF